MTRKITFSMSGEQLYRCYVEEGKSLREMERLYGYSVSTLYRWMKEFGIPFRNKKRICLDRNELYSLYIEQNISPYKIADMMNVSATTVYNELKRHEISIRSRSESKMGDKNPLFGVSPSVETIEKRAIKLRGRVCSEEVKHRISVKNGGENNGMWKGVPFIKICENCGVEFRRHNGNIDQRFCSIKCARQGEHNSAWKGGVSFEPYCPAFNFELKEKIRNQYNRVCVISGISALQNGRRLDVDHVDENKMQGCNGVKWRLVPLTHGVHTKMGSLQNHLLLELLLYGNKNAEMNYEF